jgi:spermidine synthase
LALGLMAASGFAGLGYQIVWTQQAALWLGHEAAAVLAVLTAFFGGLGLGALLLGPRIQRSPQPQRWYAACEAAIAVWSLVLALLLAPVSDAVLGLTGVGAPPLWQWIVAFGATLVLLLPATLAMGATLPAMESLMARLHPESSAIAALYAGNTAGAVLGVLAAAFWLVPEWGLARTAVLCAGLNLLCAAGALVLARGATPVATPVLAGATQHGPTLARLAATGLLGIGYEVLVVRVLSQLSEDTVYTFALLLAVYLVFTALGAAAWQAGASRWPNVARSRKLLLQALAVSCLLGTSSLWGAEAVRDTLLRTLGPGMASALVAEAAPALAAFALPTFFMGALFSQLATRARAEGIGFGLALGANTLGAATAPLLFGVGLVPAFGAKPSLLLVSVGYLALCAPRCWRTPGVWAPAAAALALAGAAPALVFVEVPEGGRVVSYREGALAAVSVVEDGEGVSRLRIDNRQQEGSSGTLLADARQALLPLLLHPGPQRALFLGLGTGVTASAAAQDPSLQVDAAELLPEVIAASAHFTRAFEQPPQASRLHAVAADARRYVRAAGPAYDLIVADNFHPARSGSGALYTVEHFAAVRGRLAAGGLFCQWLPLHQLDLDTLRSIVKAYTTVYPGAWAMLATQSLQTPVLGLVARRTAGPDADRFDPAVLRQRLASTALPQPLADFGIADEFSLLGGFVAGPRSLARFSAAAPVNTDDRPVVAYRAPRITYAPDSAPADRLLTLLGELQLDPDEVLAQGSTDGHRLAAYWAARDLFLASGRAVRPAADVKAMLAQVQDPLLAVLRISPDFRPAYDPLLQMALVLGRSDAAAARALLGELQRVQPARPEAAQALAAGPGSRP